RRLQPFVSDPDRRRRLAALVFEEAGRAEIPPGLVFAVIQVESNFQRFALSHAGARGLMQIMPFWREEIGRPGDNLFEPRTNLRYGCTILRHYLEQEGGDILRALAAYNGSTGRTIYPEKIHKAYRGRWAENR
ncbi:MAG: lytic transglycosylase domain-containing protein, partial [Thiohalorhabdus sp.]|uniref:lytic transglycosylase domain-containing protein n=1 Tax=Thiohalorhabdus sp. TaxID=3094134 RepID=UPI0039810C78